MLSSKFHHLARSELEGSFAAFGVGLAWCELQMCLTAWIDQLYLSLNFKNPNVILFNNNIKTIFLFGIY
jgi:hypothetical protein